MKRLLLILTLICAAISAQLATAATTVPSPRIEYCVAVNDSGNNTNTYYYGEVPIIVSGQSCFPSAASLYAALIGEMNRNVPSPRTVSTCTQGPCSGWQFTTYSTFAQKAYPDYANCAPETVLSTDAAGKALGYCGVERTDNTTAICVSGNCSPFDFQPVTYARDGDIGAKLNLLCRDAAMLKTGVNKAAGCANLINIFSGYQECPSCAGRASGGNPIYPMTGAKKEVVPTSLSVGGQTFTLTYSTLRHHLATAGGLTSAAQLNDLPSFGALWTGNLHRRLNLQAMTPSIGIDAYRGDGRMVGFGLTANPGGTYVPAAGIDDTLTIITGGYRYFDAAAKVIETYNSVGRLTSMADASGNTLTFSYSAGASAAAPAAGYLLSVTDNVGRSISFTYTLPTGGSATSDGLVSTITATGGSVITAAYDANKNLTALTWPDGRSRSFLYENPSLPWALTGKTDENGVRVSSWTYDAEGRALSSDSALGTNHYGVSYSTLPKAVITETIVRNMLNYGETVYRNHSWQAPTGLLLTDANGTTANATVVMPNGYPVLAGMSQAAGSGCMASNSASTFDARGNLLSLDDFQGNRTCYVYDANNRETVRVEGLANTVACSTVTPDGVTLPANARKTLTSWHPDWRLVNSTFSPGLVANTVYHGQPDPFNGNAIANCTAASNLPNGKPIPLVCKEVERGTLDVATGAGGDLSGSNVVLLLHGDGPNGSTIFTDSSTPLKTVTAVGNPQISTAQSKVGGASISFNGNGSYLTTPYNSGFDLPGDFTIESWVRLAGFSPSYGGSFGAAILGGYVWVPFADIGWVIRIEGTASAYNKLVIHTGLKQYDISGLTFGLNTWYHVAVTRSAGTMRAFVNGVQVGGDIANSDAFTRWPGSVSPFYIGAQNDTGSPFYLNGNLDEVRITKGIARYTTAFTPPDQPFAAPVKFDTSSVARIRSFTYDAAGRILTSKDANNRTTTYAYYAATNFTGVDPNAIGQTIGDLQSITNPAGHVTQFTLYDRMGRIRQMVDPKGVVTDISYTPRGWVSTVTTTPAGGTARTTSYAYDNAGQLTGVSQPDGTALSYRYDAAHRLIGATDAKGNSVNYTLDNVGNRIAEEVRDPTGTLQRSISRSFDALNRLQQVTGAAQ